MRAIPPAAALAAALVLPLQPREAVAQPQDTPSEAWRLKAIVEDEGRRRAFFLVGTRVVEASVGASIPTGRVEAIEREAVVIGRDGADRGMRLELFPAGTKPLAAPPSRPGQGAPISVALASDDLRDLVILFAKASGLNVVLQNTARCAPLTRVLRAWPWDAALEKLLQDCGLGYSVEGLVVRVGPKADLARFPYVERQHTGLPVTIEFTRVRLPDLWRVFEQVSGLKVEPHRDGEATLLCDECPWDQMFDALARSQGLGYTTDGRVIRLKTLP